LTRGSWATFGSTCAKVEQDPEGDQVQLTVPGMSDPARSATQAATSSTVNRLRIAITETLPHLLERRAVISRGVRVDVDAALEEPFRPPFDREDRDRRGEERTKCIGRIAPGGDFPRDQVATGLGLLHGLERAAVVLWTLSQTALYQQ